MNGTEAFWDGCNLKGCGLLARSFTIIDRQHLHQLLLSYENGRHVWAMPNNRRIVALIAPKRRNSVQSHWMSTRPVEGGTPSIGSAGGSSALALHLLEDLYR